MNAALYYTIRSRVDGNYLVAHPDLEARDRYLLVFAEHYEALSYLNTHAQEIASQFTVESVGQSQLRSILDRWQYQGIGVVQDPLLPRIEFMGLAA
jgi:hypothetical protein